LSILDNLIEQGSRTKRAHILDAGLRALKRPNVAYWEADVGNWGKTQNEVRQEAGKE
jgi:hypothetical protein